MSDYDAGGVLLYIALAWGVGTMIDFPGVTVTLTALMLIGIGLTEESKHV